MLSVIILSFNTLDKTRKCLECLYRSTFGEFETIVVDNASTDGSLEMIQKDFPQVQLIKNSDNVGFALGNNQGMRNAKGDLLLLLNSDAYVFEDTIQLFYEYFIAHQDVDIAGCQLLNTDGTIQSSWGYFPTLRRIFQMMFFLDNLPLIREYIDSIHIRSTQRYYSPKRADWVTGAFLFLRKSVFLTTEGFDGKFFMYGEEIEWLYRCKKAKYQIWYLPIAQCIHALGGSSSDRSPAVIGEINGWKYWFEKHNPGWHKPFLLFAILLGCSLRMILKPQQRNYYKQALFQVTSDLF